MRYQLIFLFLLASGCSSIKATNLKKPPQIIQRGWAYIEPEQDLLNLEAGVQPVSKSAPVIVGEKLIYGSERFGLSAISRGNGHLLWRKQLDEEVIAPPLVKGTQLFVGSGSGNFFAFDSGSGRELWQVNLGAPVHGTPTYAFDRIYVGTQDDAVHSIDPATGKVLWNYRRPLQGSTTIRGGGNPSAVAGN